MDATLDSPKAALPAVGSLLANKYELVSVLGEGGMGIVYEAIHVRLAQRVAIKILRAEFLVDTKHVARFEREARLAARLRSVHTVRIFDVDTTPGGIPYMVMELLHGRDLADEVDARGDVPASELALWMRQLCTAVAEAHQAGVIHRDLKPSNVFLCHSGDRTVAKVLDFGISKAVGGHVGDATTATQDSVVGTPRYMSPEQVRGAGEIDGRSDIWAIGVMMYRVLAGTYPFDGASSAQIAVAIANQRAVNLRVHRPELPGSLVAVVMKAMAKRPEDRFATADDLADALAPFCDPSAPAPMRASSHPASLASFTVRGLTSPTPGAVPPSSPRRARWGIVAALGGVLALAAVALPFVAARPHGASHPASAAPLSASVIVPLPIAPSEPAAPPVTLPTTSASVAPVLPVASASSPPSRKSPERRTKTRPAPPAASASAPPATTPSDDPLHL